MERGKKESELMKQANLLRVTAVGRCRSGLVVARQLQDDASERIVLAQADVAEAIADLERARATEKNLLGQLERALATEAQLRDQLQGAEEV
jgi:hypothetical protein